MKNKKRKTVTSLCLAMMMVLMMGMSAFAQSAQPRSDYSNCYVNTEGGNLNCRKGPGTEYEIVGKFKNGTQLSWSVFGKTDSLGRPWTQVSGKDVNGKQISGWVLDSYLRYEDSRSIVNVIIDENMPDVG